MLTIKASALTNSLIEILVGSNKEKVHYSSVDFSRTSSCPSSSFGK